MSVSSPTIHRRPSLTVGLVGIQLLQRAQAELHIWMTLSTCPLPTFPNTPHSINHSRDPAHESLVNVTALLEPTTTVGVFLRQSIDLAQASKAATLAFPGMQRSPTAMLGMPIATATGEQDPLTAPAKLAANCLPVPRSAWTILLKAADESAPSSRAR